MSILLIEGFDFGRGQDFTNFWSHNAAYTDQVYVDGYLSGKALEIGHRSASVTPAVASSTGSTWARTIQPAPTAMLEARVGCMIKRTSSVGGPDANRWGQILSLTFGSHAIAMQLKGSGDIRLAYSTNASFYLLPTDAATAAVSASSVAGDIDNWHAYELHVDWVTKAAELWIDGSLAISMTGLTGTPTATIPFIGLGTWQQSGLANSGKYMRTAYDHVWLTTGNRLTGANKYHAVYPAGTIAVSSTGPGVALRGFIEIAAVRYYATGYVVGRASSIAVYNAVQAGFPLNPATGTAWDTAGWTSVQNWGFCYYQYGIGTTAIDLNSAGLYYLEYETNPPLVKFQPPIGFTSTGNVTKSDAGQTLTQHIDETPYALSPDDYLIFDQPTACISDAVPTVPDPPEPPTFNIGLAFAEEFRTDYADWVSVTGGSDVESYFISGYKIQGEGNKRTQANYVSVNYETDPEGSAYINGLWDYAISGDSGRWSGTQQIYAGDQVNFSNRVRKLKIRGDGIVLQLKVVSESGKPFFINGWTTFVTGDQVP